MSRTVRGWHHRRVSLPERLPPRRPLYPRYGLWQTPCSNVHQLTGAFFRRQITNGTPLHAFPSSTQSASLLRSQKSPSQVPSQDPPRCIPVHHRGCAILGTHGHPHYLIVDCAGIAIITENRDPSDAFPVVQVSLDVQGPHHHSFLQPMHECTTIRFACVCRAVVSIVARSTLLGQDIHTALFRRARIQCTGHPVIAIDLSSPITYPIRARRPPCKHLRPRNSHHRLVNIAEGVAQIHGARVVIVTGISCPPRYKHRPDGRYSKCMHFRHRTAGNLASGRFSTLKCACRRGVRTDWRAPPG